MLLFGFSFDHDEFFPYNDESEDEGRKPVDRKPRDVASRIGSALRPQTRRMVTVTLLNGWPRFKLLHITCVYRTPIYATQGKPHPTNLAEVNRENRLMVAYVIPPAPLTLELDLRVS